MKRENFKPGTLHAPLPAVMVTVGDMENSNIITVAWTGILSSEPPRAYISVRPSRHSHKMLLENGEFVINLTTEKLAYATDYSGIYTGAKVDKFEKLSLTKVKSAEVSAPTIAESPLALECRVFERLSFGTHDVFMADIVNVSADDSLLDENGRICLERAGLMAYAHGEYFALGKKIGKFGFSAAKETKAKIKRDSARTASRYKGDAAKQTEVAKNDNKAMSKSASAAEVKEPYYAKFINKKNRNQGAKPKSKGGKRK
ncbi:MAG: flavin reductase family protein [Ruminococcaceae bacterium]|nr:flavin reductase family protein [Oscillospiraceae bacterium]